MMIKAKTLTMVVIISSVLMGYLATKDPEIDLRIKLIDMISRTSMNGMFYLTGFSRTFVSSLVPKIPAGEGPLGIFSLDLVIPPIQESVFPGIVAPEPVRVRVFYPQGNEARLPVMIQFHGGGNVMGNATDLTSDTFCRKYANEGPFFVVSVDYRLSPEYVYPASIDDAVAALLWVHSNEHPLIQKHGDPSKIILAGDSSGAHLAIAATEYAVQFRPEIRIVSQLAINPSIHYPSETDSRKLFREGYLLNSKLSQFFKNASLPNSPEFFNSVWYQPLVGKNFARYPPTHVVVADKDPLRDEGILYFNLLKHAGVKARFHTYPNSMHSFVHFDFLPQAQQAFKDIFAVLRENLASASP